MGKAPRTRATNNGVSSTRYGSPWWHLVGNTGGLWHSQCCELEAVVDLFNGDLGSLGWPEWRDGRATLSAVQARPETGRYGWQEPIHSAVGTWGSSGSGVGGGSGRSAHFERSYQLPSGDGTWLLTT